MDDEDYRSFKPPNAMMCSWLLQNPELRSSQLVAERSSSVVDKDTKVPYPRFKDDVDLIMIRRESSFFQDGSSEIPMPFQGL